MRRVARLFDVTERFGDLCEHRLVLLKAIKNADAEIDQLDYIGGGGYCHYFGHCSAATCGIV
jgi:hypothetical protein